MKQLTENDVEKALECCFEFQCDECPINPFSEDPVFCERKCKQEAINLIKRLKTEKADLETELTANKGAMRAYQEAFENAHDEAVKDFSYFLIDKAKDGVIQINDLPDLVVEWSSTKRKAAAVNAVIDEGWDMK